MSKKKLKVTNQILSDEYTDVNGKDMKSALYWIIVNEILLMIRLCKPNCFGHETSSVSLIIDNQTNCYQQLIGAVQNGKSPAIIIIIWYYTFVDFRRRPVLLIKKLNSVREDIEDKFHNGFLVDIINNVCGKHGVDPGYFMLKLHKHGDQEQQFTWRCVPVLLMERNNYMTCIKYIKRVYNEPGRCPFFIVDENHELYTDYGNFIKKKCTSGTTTGRTMLHYIHKKVEEGKAYLLGVTATPFRPLSSDPYCYPKILYNLEYDPPFPGAKYYGYSLRSNRLEGINVMIGDEVNISSTIQLIRERPRAKVQINGEYVTEIPFLLISTEREIQPMIDLAYMLKDDHGDDIFVMTLNSDNYENINAGGLNKFFSTLEKKLTDRICRQGLVCLISKGCTAASITVKPSIGKRCRKYCNDECYEIVGLTDQMVGITGSTSVENIMQIMRLSGSFPEGHTSVLWVPDENSCDDIVTGIPATRRAFESYQVTPTCSGPQSIEKMQLPLKAIKRVCAGKADDDPYVISPGSGVMFSIQDNVPENGIELKTHIMPCPPTPRRFRGYDLGRDHLLEDFFTGKNGNCNRSIQKRLYDNYLLKGTQDKKSIYAPYDVRRRDELFRSVVCPLNGTRYQINGIIWGNDGLKTPITKLYVILFTETWEKRVEAGLAYVNKDFDAVNQDKIFFCAVGAGKYLIFNMRKPGHCLYDVREEAKKFNKEAGPQSKDPKSAFKQEHWEIVNSVEHIDEGQSGTRCSICRSPGTNKSTCPNNPSAKNPNKNKHYLAVS